jgi:hypothetical protein
MASMSSARSSETVRYRSRCNHSLTQQGPAPRSSTSEPGPPGRQPTTALKIAISVRARSTSRLVPPRKGRAGNPSVFSISLTCRRSAARTSPARTRARTDRCSGFTSKRLHSEASRAAERGQPVRRRLVGDDRVAAWPRRGPRGLIDARHCRTRRSELVQRAAVDWLGRREPRDIGRPTGSVRLGRRLGVSAERARCAGGLRSREGAWPWGGRW